MDPVYEILNSAIENASEEVIEFESATKKLEAKNTEIRQLSNEKSELLLKLKKENKDVEKIIGVSFASILATVFNNREEKLEKEEREALDAKLAYDSICNEVNDCENEIYSLNMKLNKLKGSTVLYENALEAKKNQVLKNNPKVWEVVKIKELDIEIISSEIKEINEALLAGSSVSNDISLVQKELQSAKNWGTYDMLGGGFLATMAKRDHMNKAQTTINHLNRSVKNFSEELKDVNGEKLDGLDIGNYLSIMDYFFDGLIVDWAVQSKINDAITKVSGLGNEINQLTENLRNDLLVLRNRKNSVKIIIDELIRNQ